MSPNEKAQQFQQEHSQLINRALDSGVPIPSMIFSCADEEFKLRLVLQDIRSQQLAEEMRNKIIPVGNLPTEDARKK
jgi:hypothetical protein